MFSNAAVSCTKVENKIVNMLNHTKFIFGDLSLNGVLDLILNILKVVGKSDMVNQLTSIKLNF